MTCNLQQKSASVIKVNMKHHILIFFAFIFSSYAVDPFEKQFEDVDNWLYTMQAYLSSSPISQVAGKMGPIRSQCLKIPKMAHLNFSAKNYNIFHTLVSLIAVLARNLFLASFP